MRLSRYLIVLRALWAVALAGCAGGWGEGDAPEEALRRAFPEQASFVLDGPVRFEFDPGGGAFIARDLPHELAADAEHPSTTAPRVQRGRLSAAFPTRGDDPVRFRLPDGADVLVRERDAGGEAEIAAHAVAYRRPGGVSYWAATAEGYEEWLLLEPGIAWAGAPVATWDVEGARVRQRGEVLELIAARGGARLTVTAPKAFAAGGREVKATLTARGVGSFELSVDAGGEAVLVDPGWVVSGWLLKPRSYHRAVRLLDGKVLVAGGSQQSQSIFLTLAERYDPETAKWSHAGTMLTGRQKHVAELLPNGSVLVAGGVSGAPSPGTLVTAEIYDPKTNTWTPTKSMSTPRSSAGSVAIDDGCVLVVGGFAPNPTATAEIYNSETKKWQPAASMGVARAGAAATRLTNGQVLVTGGITAGSKYLASAEIYDPKANTWAPATPMSIPRGSHTSTLLPDGRVLVAGKSPGPPDGTPNPAEIYDPVSDSWTDAATLMSEHWSATATRLLSGKVLYTGGCTGCAGTPAEIYDPKADAWSEVAPMSMERIASDATLLDSGGVLITGGSAVDGTDVPFSEVFDPGAVLGALCADAGACESGFCVDGVCCDAACDGVCDACSVAAGAPKDGMCAPATGPSCDDGDPCSHGDVCQAGACAGAPVVCEPVSACHKAGACDPATGECSSPLKPDGAECPAGVCTSGVCSKDFDPTPGSGGSGAASWSSEPTPNLDSGCVCEVKGAPGSAAPFVGCAGLLLIARRRRRARLARRQARGGSAG